MTQQVLKAVTKFTSLDPMTDDPSFATYWEQIGEDTGVDQSWVAGQIEAFVNTTPTGGVTDMGSYMSSVISRSSGAASIEFYDVTAHLNGSPAGSPIGIFTFTVTDARETPMPCPDGVAQTIGYRVDYGSDVEFGTGTRPRARDRGRIYFGPLDGYCLTQESVTKRTIFTAQFINDSLLAMTKLAGTQGPDGSGGLSVNSMVVWTRVGAAVKQPITEVWADDRPDYQRRRSDPGVKTQMATGL